MLALAWSALTERNERSQAAPLEPPDDMAALEFRILGLLEIRDGGQVIELAGQKPRAVLAMLLLSANRVVPADRLAEGLWGERQPDTALNTLQSHVSKLRKLLGAGLIDTRGPGYVLTADPDRIDSFRFERLVGVGRVALKEGRPQQAADLLEEALGLWRDEALTDFALDAFAQPDIGRLSELRLAAVEDHSEAELMLGRHSHVAGSLRSLVDEYPLRERMWAQLITALYRCGRQAEALRAYEEVRARLAEELGISPATALQSLERDVLAQSPLLDWVPPVQPSDTSSGRQPADRSGPKCFLELWADRGHEFAPLDGTRVTIGRAPSSDIRLSNAKVSRLHAIVEHYPTGWSIRDMGSANGTFVNSSRIVGERRLRAGDAIDIGDVRLFFRAPESETDAVVTTMGPDGPPSEKTLLLALCRPVLEGRPARPGATVQELADTFMVSEADIWERVLRLYSTFGIEARSDPYHDRLAREAIQRRTLTRADLHESTS